MCVGRSGTKQRKGGEGMGAAAGHRVVVVTGASAGVGRATARAFAQRGADVALVARGTDGLEAAASEVENEGDEPAPPSGA